MAIARWVIGRGRAAGVVWVPDVRRLHTNGCVGARCSYQMFVVWVVGAVVEAVKVVHLEMLCETDQ